VSFDKKSGVNVKTISSNVKGKAGTGCSTPSTSNRPFRQGDLQTKKRNDTKSYPDPEAAVKIAYSEKSN
jgi:hypothetical protein